MTEKRKYEKPSQRVIESKHRTHLLQASGQKSGKMDNPDDYYLEDDPFAI